VDGGELVDDAGDVLALARLAGRVEQVVAQILDEGADHGVGVALGHRGDGADGQITVFPGPGAVQAAAEGVEEGGELQPHAAELLGAERLDVQQHRLGLGGVVGLLPQLAQGRGVQAGQELRRAVGWAAGGFDGELGGAGGEIRVPDAAARGGELLGAEQLVGDL
jgi:hypothetical protein